MNACASPPDLLVYVPFSKSDIFRNLGRPEYSYFFVMERFLPLLEAMGPVRLLPDLERLGPECAASRARGRVPVLMAFAPPHLLPFDPPCTVVPVFAWEYDTIPNENWDGDPRHDWVEMLKRQAVAITHSRHTCETVRAALGADYSIAAIPAPVWDAFDSIADARWSGRPRTVSFDGMHADTRALGADTEWSADGLGRGPGRVELSGPVFTSVLNAHDGRKNLRDLVTAFIWAFRETPDATLVLKLVHSNEAASLELVLKLLARLRPFECRVVAICAFLDDAAYHELVRATAFAVNASTGEGQCLPLMEFMSAGTPAVAPNHTAMADYIDPDNGLLLKSSREWTVWPQDHRGVLRCLRHRLDWDSLRSAYLEAFRIATEDEALYRRLSDHAATRLRAHCSVETVSGQLRRTMEAAFLAAERKEPAYRDPSLIERLLGQETPAPGDAALGGGDPGGRGVGMRDAVLSGWFRGDTGELFEGFAIAPSDMVVDVGCGEGMHLGFCARMGARLIGIDVDDKALATARTALAGSAAASIDFHLASAEDLPLDDGMATRIICSEVMEHVKDPAQALAELVRIGAPGALYLITVPDAVAEELQRHVAPDLYFREPNHVRVFERDALPRLLQDAGLEVLTHSAYGFYWAVWWGLFWGCKVDLGNPDHPTLNHWATAWSALLDTPEGRKLKEGLDAFMPKSRVFLARKPES